MLWLLNQIYDRFPFRQVKPLPERKLHSFVVQGHGGSPATVGMPYQGTTLGATAIEELLSFLRSYGSTPPPLHPPPSS